MATINLNEIRAKVYAARPDINVNMELGDGAPVQWTIKNGGRVLAFEMTRFGEELKHLSDVKTDGDEEASQRVADKLASIMTRFRAAFLSSVVCESNPESPAKFFDDNSSDLELLVAVIGQIINAAAEGSK